jgi:hypothetical protein
VGQIWDWWFNWGAIIFLVVAILLAALLLFDSYARKVAAMAWQLGVILPLLVILPSVIYKTQLPPGYHYGFPYPNNQYDSTGNIFLWIGLIAGMATIVLTIGYFMTLSLRDHPAQRPPQMVIPGGQPGPGGFGGSVAGGNPGGNYYGGSQPSNPRGGIGVAPVAQPRAVANGRLILYGSKRTYQLSQGRNTIGRDSGCDIVIDDPDVSRDHAHVQEQQGYFVLADHGSTHGTFVNGQRIGAQQQLLDGDQLLFGPNVTGLFRTP